MGWQFSFTIFVEERCIDVGYSNDLAQAIDFMRRFSMWVPTTINVFVVFFDRNQDPLIFYSGFFSNKATPFRMGFDSCFR